MNVIPENEALNILQPHFGKLAAAFAKGEQTWRQFTVSMPEAAIAMSRRGQSNMLYDFITKAAEVAFAFDAPHVRVRWQSGFLILLFEDRLAIRFKKFKRGRMYETYGIQTRQRRLWDSQQSVMPELPQPVTHAVAGYLLDELRQSLMGTWVACRDGRFLEWAIEVPDAGAASGGLPSGLPYKPVTPQAPIVRSAYSPQVEDDQAN